MPDKKKFLEFYRKVLLIRKCEEAIRKEYHKNEMKTPVHLCNGSEGIAVGAASALPKNSKVFGTYRNHGLYLAFSDDTDGFFAELYGKSTGCAQGKAGSMHLTCPDKGLYLTSAVVGTTIPVAVGAALANSYYQNKDLVAAVFGDGAVEEGVFWESLNFACLHKLRMIFICEDNGLAIHTPGSERRGFRSIAEAVAGFNCHRFSEEGYFADKVFNTVAQAIQSIEKDPKPAFLYFNYFRNLEHVGIAEDFSAGYRTKPDEKTLREWDPVVNAGKGASESGCSEAQLRETEETVNRKIAMSLEKARIAPFPPLQLLTEHVFA